MEIKIYVITNKINGLLYIGQTQRELKERLRSHFNDLKKKKGNKKFINDFTIYGKDNFEIFLLDIIKMNDFILNEEDYDYPEFIESLIQTDADNMEQYYIKTYDTVENGYNRDFGGKISKQQSLVTKEKISKINKGKNHPNYGKHLSLETRQKISKSKKGIPASEEMKTKLSKTTRGLKKKSMSPETKEKLSKINKGKKMSEETKRKISQSSKIKISEGLIKQIEKFLSDGITIKKIIEISGCSKNVINRIRKNIE